MRRRHGIVSAEFKGLEHLRESLAAGCAVVLTPNHCHPADPPLMGWLSRTFGHPFYYMASSHLFMESKLQAFILQSFGAFSVYREGADKTAIKASIAMLVDGKRPLVIFPEGFIARANDRIRPFMDGISLIIGLASREREKRGLTGPIKAHPVAIRYKLLTDPAISLQQTLEEIEQKFFWRNHNLPLRERIVKVGEALLTLKEMEFFNEAGSGSFEKRLEQLIGHLLEKLEKRWTNGKRHPKFFENVNALRRAILEKLMRDEIPEEETRGCWEDLADIDLAVQLSCYPADYLGENPSMERMTEMVQQFEEDTLGKSRIHAKWKAIVQIGEGIEADSMKGEKLNVVLQNKVQELLLSGSSK